MTSSDESCRTKPYLWLHIRKAGGTSLREALGDSYRQIDRFGPVTPFVALERIYWNDALNNYRLPLGNYEFRRMQFAKNFLFPEPEFSRLFKFAIVRNPYSRAVSAWKYLTRRWNWSRPRQMLSHYSFAHFLDRLPEFWDDFTKWRHVATHTAPIWPDITDENGSVLLDYIGRVETLESDYIQICERIGISLQKLPINNKQKDYNYKKYYNRKSRYLVEKYYWEDINELKYDF